jgi:hypothetical protein
VEPMKSRSTKSFGDISIIPAFRILEDCREIDHNRRGLRGVDGNGAMPFLGHGWPLFIYTRRKHMCVRPYFLITWIFIV